MAQTATTPQPGDFGPVTPRRPVVERSLRGFTGAGYDKGAPCSCRPPGSPSSTWSSSSGGVQPRWRPALRAFGARVGQRSADPARSTECTGRGSWTSATTCGSARAPGSSTSNPSRSAATAASRRARCCARAATARVPPTFEFDNGPIRLEPGSWVAARAVVLRPGSPSAGGGVVGAGAVAHRDLAPGAVLTTKGRTA